MKLVHRDPNTGYLDGLLWIPKNCVNEEGVKNALEFTFFENRQPEILQLWKETTTHLAIPREFFSVAELGIKVVDCRPSSYPHVSIKSRIILDAKAPHKTVQRDALDAMYNARGGILELACGKGKTVIFLELLSRLHVPAIIAVDNLNLLYQWRREILKHLEVSEDDIGLIAEGEFDWKKPIVLATYTSLADRADSFPEEARRWFGVFCGDEGHHLKARTWCRAVDLFPCRRYALTATPKTADGRHVIYDFHVGPTVFRDKSQDLRPDVGFLWTGLEVDMTDDRIRDLVCDKNGELHGSKLASYFGQWPERLMFNLTELKKLYASKRRILALSNSVAETVNLLALWNGITDLYSDIPEPTPADVGETVPAEELDERKLGTLKRSLGSIIGQLKDPGLQDVKRKNLEKTKKEILFRLLKHRTWEKVQLELHRRQRAYIKKLVEDTKDGEAGLMIHKVKPEVRARMLQEKTIVFAITKYGREGLDEQRLDTLYVCEPITDAGGLEQMMGRVQRASQGKQRPLVLFVEDKIGLMIGMCNKLRGHLRNWPMDQGGPYDYDLIGHPNHKFKMPVIRY